MLNQPFRLIRDVKGVETYLRRPVVGLKPTIPHMAAGRRTLPPMSVPNPRAEPPPPIKAASPPLDPWGVLSCRRGLRVTPSIGLLHWVLKNKGELKESSYSHQMLR